MAPLSRRAAPLLRVVGGRPHARDADHEEAPDTPGAGRNQDRSKQEDITRDPDSGSSSDSEPEPDQGKAESKTCLEPQPRRYQPRVGVPKVRPPPRLNRPGTANIHGSSKEDKPPVFKAPPSADAQSETKPGSEPLQADKENEAETVADRIVLFSSQESRKRGRTTGYGKKSGAGLKKVKKVDSKSSIVPELVAFKQPKGKIQNKHQPEVLPTLRKHSAMEPSNLPREMSSRGEDALALGPVFRKPAGTGEGSIPNSTETSAITKITDSPSSPRSRSSSLTSLAASEPEVQEVQGPPASDSQVGMTSCPMCGEAVEESFKNDFQIERCGGRRMNIRLQELFCKAHKERSAKQAWQDREYPEIEWSQLHERLERHHDRIHGVLDGRIRSTYREDLRKRLSSGKTKTAVQTWDNEETKANVGYYGSRGERLMTDHIINTFDEKLRSLAGTDKVIAAMGVSGGISGYCTHVLVPEMALALVMEDASCGVEDAKRIISESSAIGEAVNEAEEEMVVH